MQRKTRKKDMEIAAMKGRRKRYRGNTERERCGEGNKSRGKKKEEENSEELSYNRV